MLFELTAFIEGKLDGDLAKALQTARNRWMQSIVARSHPVYRRTYIRWTYASQDPNNPEP